MGCDQEPTEVVVIIDLADDVSERDALQLRLEIDSVVPPEDAEPRPLKPASWPYKIALHPKGGDTARRYSLTATALDAGEEPVAAARLISGFVADERRYVRLLLAASCDPAQCDLEQTCAPERAAAGGDDECVDGVVDPTRFARSEDRAPDLNDLLKPLVDGGTTGASGEGGVAGRGASGRGGGGAPLPDGGTAGSGGVSDGGGGDPPCTPGTTDCVTRLSGLRAETAPGEDALEPLFDPENEAYSLSVPLAVGSVRIAARAPSPATIRIGDRPVASDAFTEIAVPAGSSELSITVAAPKQATTTYVIAVTRGAQAAYLKANDRAMNDRFGGAVAISGDTLVVGAANHASATGSVYVFTREAGAWTREASFYGESAGDRFGASVAIAGDVVAVGAPGAQMATGAVHIFTRVGSNWSPQTALRPSETEMADEFGCSVALAGDTLVAGALFESGSATGVNGNVNEGAFQSGAAYVFQRNNVADWDQVAYLKADNTTTRHKFGAAVAISESADVIAVAATGDESMAALGKGAVHLFEKGATDWAWAQAVRADSAVGSAVFGFSVAVSDDTLAIGARGETEATAGVGAGYVFQRPAGGAWQRAGEVLGPRLAQDGDGFGSSVSIAGDLLVIGAAYESGARGGVSAEASAGDDGEADSGAVYAYFRGDTGWTEQAYLKAHNPGADDLFGLSVATSQGTIVVGSLLEDSDQAGPTQGSPGDSDNDASPNSGAAYVFH